MTEHKAGKSRDSLRLQCRVDDLGSLHKRSQNSSPATSITPLFPMTLLDAELHQCFGCWSLLLRGYGEDLPHELRCLPIHGLHLNGVAFSSSDGACEGEGAGGGVGVAGRLFLKVSQSGWLWRLKRVCSLVLV